MAVTPLPGTRSVEEAAPPVNPDTQPEEAEAETFSLDAMLLGLTPQTAGPETRAEKLPALLHKAASAPTVTPPAADDDELVVIDGVPNRPLRPGEKISLDVLLGTGRRKTGSSRPAVATPAPAAKELPTLTAPAVQEPAAPPAPASPPVPPAMHGA